MNDLIAECGDVNIPGVEVTTYWVNKNDIETFPVLKLPSTTAGDSITLAGDIVLKTNKKFAKVDLIVDTGEVKDTMVGAVGSRSYESMLDGVVASTNPNVLEFFNNVANSCPVVLVKEKSGKVRVLGSKNIPARLEKAELTTGKDSGGTRGSTFTIKSTVGTVAPIYTGTIDLDDKT